MRPLPPPRPGFADLWRRPGPALEGVAVRNRGWAQKRSGLRPCLSLAMWLEPGGSITGPSPGSPPPGWPPRLTLCPSHPSISSRLPTLLKKSASLPTGLQGLHFLHSLHSLPCLRVLPCGCPVCADMAPELALVISANLHDNSKCLEQCLAPSGCSVSVC